MKYDFYFQLHCSNCDFNKSSPEYTMQHACPKCHSEMKLVTVKFGKHVTDTHLKNILRNLLEQKNQGDDIAKRTFYIISDITDPDVKKVFDEVVSEEYIRKRKLKFSPADSQTATTELATDTPSKKSRVTKKVLQSLFDDIGDVHVFTAPDIPDSKLSAALMSYAPDVLPKDVLVLVDNTVWGGAKEGLIVTRKKLYAKELWTTPISRTLREDSTLGFTDANELTVNGVQLIRLSLIKNSALQKLAEAIQSMCDICAGGSISVNVPETKKSQSAASETATEPSSTKSRITKKTLLSLFADISDVHIFMAPDIPENKLSAALMSYAPDVLPKDVLVLVDDTVWGGAKEGLIVTRKKLYAKELWTTPISRTLREDTTLGFTATKELTVNGTQFIRLSQLDISSLQKLTEAIQLMCDTCFSGSISVNIPETKKSQSASPEVVTETSSTKSKITPKALLSLFDDISDVHIFTAPDIPENKLSAALMSYAPDVLPQEVLVLVDDTVWGGAKEGLIVTRKKLYAKAFLSSPVSQPLRLDTKLEYSDTKELMVNGAHFVSLVLPGKSAMQKLTEAIQLICYS